MTYPPQPPQPGPQQPGAYGPPPPPAGPPGAYGHPQQQPYGQPPAPGVPLQPYPLPPRRSGPGPGLWIGLGAGALAVIVAVVVVLYATGAIGPGTSGAGPSGQAPAASGYTMQGKACGADIAAFAEFGATRPLTAEPPAASDSVPTETCTSQWDGDPAKAWSSGILTFEIRYYDTPEDAKTAYEAFAKNPTPGSLPADFVGDWDGGSAVHTAAYEGQQNGIEAALHDGNAYVSIMFLWEAGLTTKTIGIDAVSALAADILATVK